MATKNRFCKMHHIVFAMVVPAVMFMSAGVSFGVEISSKAALVIEAETGRVLYAKNPSLKLMPASTTKLVTALVVVEKAKMNDMFTVSKLAEDAPPTKMGLKAGQKVRVESLLYAALMKSANDAAIVLAEGVGGSVDNFVRLMNRKAMEMGARDSRFINPHGLPGDGQYVTAYDLSKVMRHAIKHPVLRQIMGTRIAELNMHEGDTVFIKNTNKLLWTDNDVVGGKTGYTRGARHCFTCAAERRNKMLVVALLGTPTRDRLWSESELLLDFGERVIRKEEEPVVYISKSDYDSMKIRKASYTNKAVSRNTTTYANKSSGKESAKSGLSANKSRNKTAKNSKSSKTVKNKRTKQYERSL